MQEARQDCEVSLECFGGMHETLTMIDAREENGMFREMRLMREVGKIAQIGNFRVALAILPVW